MSDCKRRDIVAILFTDLDGTLIFSAKRKTDGDIVVERKNGEEISCISSFQREKLAKLENVVPVTTRSIEQYKRIQFPDGFSPKYAITDNGGTLLINGVPDPEWAKWANACAKECEAELSLAREILEREPDRCFEVRTVDGLFLFTKSRNPEKTVSLFGKGELCEAFFTGEKVYVIPKKINKGSAAKRLLSALSENEKIGTVYCAGDSRMDIPLLNIGDAAICPQEIAELLCGEKRVLSPANGRFTDFVTETYYLNQNR